MKSSAYYLIPLGIFIALSVFLWKGLSIDHAHLPSTRIDQVVPKFSASTLDKDLIVTENIFNGRITLLNFWATWCTTCKQEHAFWMKHIKEFSPNLQLLAVNYHDEDKLAKAWLSNDGNPFSIVIKDPLGRLGMDWGVRGTPETFVIDKQGIVRYRHAGPIDDIAWTTVLLPLIQTLEKQ